MKVETKDYQLLEAKARKRARNNIEKWGLQKRETLLLVMLEELGELTQAHLQSDENLEQFDISNEYQELYDLMAVMYAYYIELEYARYGHTEFNRIEYFYDSDELKYTQE